MRSHRAGDAQDGAAVPALLLGSESMDALIRGAGIEELLFGNSGWWGSSRIPIVDKITVQLNARIADRI